MIERLLIFGSILELAMRRSVLGKDILLLFPVRVKQSTTFVVAKPSLKKDLQQNPKKSDLRWFG